MADALLSLTSIDDHEASSCLLDAFCEDEGFPLAKLDEVEWRLNEEANSRSRSAAERESNCTLKPACDHTLVHSCGMPSLALCE